MTTTADMYRTIRIRAPRTPAAAALAYDEALNG